MTLNNTDLDDDWSYVAETTDDDIAPKAIVEPISCNCGGHCSDGRCGCKKNKVVCTDFWGCCDTCENIDHPPPDTINKDLDKDE